MPRTKNHDDEGENILIDGWLPQWLTLDMPILDHHMPAIGARALAAYVLLVRYVSGPHVAFPFLSYLQQKLDMERKEVIDVLRILQSSRLIDYDLGEKTGMPHFVLLDVYSHSGSTA